MLEFEASLRQVLTLKVVSARRLDPIFHFGIPHVAVLQHARIEDEDVVREPAVRVEQRMGAEVNRTLRQGPFHQLHPVGIHLLVEVDARARRIFGHLVETVQRAVTAEADPLVPRTRIVVPDRIDRVQHGRLRRSRREGRDPRVGIQREQVQDAAGVAGGLLPAGILVALAEDERKFERDSVIETLALLVVLQRVASTELRLRCRFGDLVGSLPDLAVVVHLGRVASCAVRRKTTFGKGIANFRQVDALQNRYCRRTCLRPLYHDHRRRRDGADHEQLVIVGSCQCLLHQQHVARNQISCGLVTSHADGQRRVRGAESRRIRDLQPNGIELFFPPVELRVVDALTLHFRQQSRQRSHAVGVPPEDHLAEALWPFVGTKVASTSQARNCSHVNAPLSHLPAGR